MTNDAKNPEVDLWRKMTILTALDVVPSLVNFGKLKRHAEAQTRTLMVTRTDAPVIQPKIVSTSDERISARLYENEAGERYTLSVTIQPPWPNMRLSGYITLDTGVRELPQIDIRLTALFEPRLHVSPRVFHIPRYLPDGTKLEAELVWSENDAAQILEVTTSDAALKATVVQRDERQVLVLDVPAHYVLPKYSFVTVKTDDPAVSELRIPVRLQRAKAEPASGSSIPCPLELVAISCRRWLAPASIKLWTSYKEIVLARLTKASNSTGVPDMPPPQRPDNNPAGD